MRLIRLTFFTLLVAHIALLLLAPTPAPRMYRAVQLAVVVANIACLAALSITEWADGRREKRRSESAEVPD